MWSFETASVIGASHVRKGTINQDRVGSIRGDGVVSPLVVAAADGHGSAAYFRSHVGAEFAVAAACMTLADACKSEDFPTWGRMSESQRWRIEDRIVRRIVAEWMQRVRAHIDEYPATESEQPLTLNAYGCTLLAAVTYKGHTCALQIGDGDILFCAADGAAQRLIAADTSLIANETHSLCLKNAAQYFRFGYAENRPETATLLLLCTDGYTNSFASDAGFMRALGDIHALLPTIRRDSLAGMLKEWAQTSTDSGSGDDVSIVLAFDEPVYFRKVPPPPVVDEPVSHGCIAACLAWIMVLTKDSRLLLANLFRSQTQANQAAHQQKNQMREDTGDTNAAPPTP
jgi:serine/threonine protein phosphatase PrpC